MTNKLGIGVMITKEVKLDLSGHTILGIHLDPEYNHGDGGLVLLFEPGELVVYDDGRSCCESRYIQTDDDLQAFVGAELTSIEVREMPDVVQEPDPDGWSYSEPHKQQALVVDTTLGSFTVVTHNEHNGYYGGFYMKADFTPNPDEE